MSQELITKDQAVPPFGSRNTLPAGVNSGAVAIEQERAVAEAQGQLVLAKKFPRDLTGAHAELMKACQSHAFAAQAFYAVPNRGSGPSIRFAEEVARVYGNFQYGHRELGRTEGKSEVEVFAWDMQNNNRSTRQITVMHVTDTKNGPKILKDQADIDNKIANVASKQMRGRILALMPKWLVAEAIEECRKTLAGNNTEPLDVRVRKMTQAFTRFGVTTAHLEAYLGHSLDQVLLDELVDMQGVFNALREGTPASDFFGAAEKEAQDADQAASLAATAKAGAATKAANKPPAKSKTEPKKETVPQPAQEPDAAPAPDAVAEPKSNPDESASSNTESNSNVEQALSSNEESAPEAEAYADSNPDTTEDGDLF